MSKIEDLGLKERIYTQIRDKIFRLEFAPGEKLPEQKLAEEFGVSRPLVREAISSQRYDPMFRAPAPTYTATLSGFLSVPPDGAPHSMDIHPETAMRAAMPAIRAMLICLLVFVMFL